MSLIDNAIYKASPNGNNLDFVRNSFYGLWKNFEKEGRKNKFGRIGNSFTFYSGQNYEGLNIAAVYDGSPEVLEQLLREVSTWNIKSGVLLAGDGLRHANHLIERGYVHGQATPFMAAQLDNRFSDFTLRDGLEARRVENREEFEEYIKIMTTTFGMTDTEVRELAEPHFGLPATYRYVLYDNGIPVSTNLFVVVDEFAGCFDVATPEEHQRKGYGAELMKFMMKEQYEMGTKVVSLQSSPAGEKLYRSLGFQILEYQQTWRMSNPVLLKRFDCAELNFGPYHLRQLTKEDEALLIEKFQEAEIQKWMGIAPDFGPTHFAEFLKSCDKQYFTGKGCWWIIEEAGKPLGQIFLFKANWLLKKVEIGYLAYPEARGKGMITFLAKEISNMLIEKYGMERVELTTDSVNDKSGYVARQAGFSFEGTLRKDFMYREKLLDKNLYSKIASDLD